MEIKKLETREKWLCNVDGHSYVREVIHWTDDRPDTTHWWLNEDYVEGVVFLNEDELEESFLSNSGQPDLSEN